MIQENSAGVFSDQPVLTSAAALAAVFFALYTCVRCGWQKKSWALDLGGAVVALMACSATVGGVLVMASAFFPQLEKHASELKFSMVVGGFALVWVSLRELVTLFRRDDS